MYYTSTVLPYQEITRNSCGLVLKVVFSYSLHACTLVSSHKVPGTSLGDMMIIVWKLAYPRACASYPVCDRSSLTLMIWRQTSRVQVTEVRDYSLAGDPWGLVTPAYHYH